MQQKSDFFLNNKTFNKSFIISKILYKIPFITNISCSFNNARNNQIKNKLMPLFDFAYKETMEINNLEKKSSNIVWFFWWQGKDHMTLLTQKCYKSVLKNRGKRQVILITKDNIHNYADLSPIIYKKVSEGKITFTHLSDILRFNLLKTYGGLWVDATMYITGSLDKYNTSTKLITHSENSYIKSFNIAHARWTGFFIGGPANSKLFVFMNKFFYEYWKNNDELIDYFLIDYALDYAWNKNLSNFKNITRKNINSDPDLYNLEPIINEDFNNIKWNNFINKTRVFKLSNRKKIINNPNSYFSKL